MKKYLTASSTKRAILAKSRNRPAPQANAKAYRDKNRQSGVNC